MTKNLKLILIVIAVALITVIAGGLIIHFARGDKGGDKTDNNSNTLTAQVEKCVLQDTLVFCGEPNTVQPMSLATYSEVANEQVVSGNSTTLTLKLTSNVLSEVMLEKINVPVTWGVEFVNADSTWASGKNVSDYLTVTPKSDFTRTVTITNKAPFGEQIRLTAALDGDSSKTASCTVDYVKRVGGGFYSLSCNSDFGDDLAIWGSIYTDEAVGTRYGEVVPSSATIDIESGFISLLKSYLKFDISITSVSLSNRAVLQYLDYHQTYKYYSIGITAADSQGKEKVMDYSDFISNWGSLSEAQKTAVKFAWWKAYQAYDGDNVSVDVIFDYKYDGRTLTTMVGNMTCYISGECYGDGITVDGSLVNIVF